MRLFPGFFVLLYCSVEQQITSKGTMQTLLFQPGHYFSPQLYLFKETDLGKIFDTIPREQLWGCLPEENKWPRAPRGFSQRPRKPKTMGQIRPAHFSQKSKNAMMSTFWTILSEAKAAISIYHR